MATVVIAIGAIADSFAAGHDLIGLVQPGADGPSAEIFEKDFPDADLPPGLGHDGQQIYVIARSPTDLDLLESQLDDARYRLQRPLMPALGRLFYPPGSGDGLVIALVVVGALSLFALGVAAGHLSLALGGGPWVAAIAPALPGGYATFRLGLADNLALALAVAALLAVERRRMGWAVVAAVGAVLAKEVMIVLFAARAVFGRSRVAVASMMLSGAVALGWFLMVRILVARTDDFGELVVPFTGYVDSVDYWADGRGLVSLLTIAGAVTLTVAALVARGRRHPLFGPVLAFAAIAVLFSENVVGPDFNGPRNIGPLLLLAILMVATDPQPESAPVHGSRSATVELS